jgi:hypothetical protein
MNREELVLQERAPQAEALRCVPQETIDDLCRADLLRAPVPERFGGCGLDVDLIPSVAAELGRGCGSTAWCYGIWAASNWAVGMYPAQAQEEYWATGVNTLCANSLNPAGATSVTAVPGGYRLSGQWDFASGCDAATWVLVMGAGPAGVLMFLRPPVRFCDPRHVVRVRPPRHGEQGRHHPGRLCARASGAARDGHARGAHARTGHPRDSQLPYPHLLCFRLCAGSVPGGHGPGRSGDLPGRHATAGLGPPRWADGPAHRRPGALSGGHHGGGRRAPDYAPRYARDPGTGTAQCEAHAGRAPAYPAQPGVCGHPVRAGREPSVRRERRPCPL